MSGGKLDQNAIEEIIPHRYPFLFIYEIEEVDFGHRAVGLIRDVAIFREVLHGHFPGYPVFPGALLVEALAEVGAIAMLGMEANRGKLAFITGLNNWKFRKPALPGVMLRLEVSLTASRGQFGRAHGCVTTAAGELVCEGDFSFALGARPPGMEG